MKTLDERRETRNRKDAEHKSVLNIFKEKLKLYEAKRNLGYIELDEPIFKGYYRNFKLRKDLYNTQAGNLALIVLPLIQNIVHCKRKDFQTKSWKTKKLEPIGQGLRCLSKKDYDKLEPKFQKLFDPVYSYRSKCWEYKYIWDWHFVYHIDKWYLTKVPVLSPDLQSQIAEIENRIQTHNLWPKINKIFGWRTRWDYENSKLKSMLKALDKIDFL